MPPPVPQKPWHLASAPPVACPPAVPEDPPERPPKVPAPAFSSPPEYCRQCGVVHVVGAAAIGAVKTSEWAVVENMDKVPVFQIATGDAHGAILAGGKRKGRVFEARSRL